MFNPNPLSQTPMPNTNWQNPWNAPAQPPQPAPMVPNWNRPTQSMSPAYTGIPGRAISNPQEIRPNEVPMDGTAGLFPMSDYSCIYVKAWGADGNIQTVRYVPEQPVEKAAQGPSQFDQVMERLTTIENAIAQMKVVKENPRSQKKEVAKDGE